MRWDTKFHTMSWFVAEESRELIILKLKQEIRLTWSENFHFPNIKLKDPAFIDTIL